MVPYSRRHCSLPNPPSPVQYSPFKSRHVPPSHWHVVSSSPALTLSPQPDVRTVDSKLIETCPDRISRWPFLAHPVLLTSLALRPQIATVRPDTADSMSPRHLLGQICLPTLPNDITSSSSG